MKNKKKTKKKVLLLGKRSFFAKNIINFLKNFNVTLIGRKQNINDYNLKNYDYIINCAADVFNEKLMFKNNVYFVLNLLNQYIQQKSKARIVHFGSAGEYGKLNFAPKENIALKPLSTYQYSKALASILISLISIKFHIPIIILRCYSIYGPFENSNKYIPKLIRHFEKNEKLNIYQGSQDYFYIDNLGEIILNLLKNKKKFSKNVKIINVGSGNSFSNISVYKIFEKIYKKKGRAKNILKYQKKTDNKIWICNNKKLKSMKMFKKISLIKGLNKYLKNMHKNKKLYNHIFNNC